MLLLRFLAGSVVVVLLLTLASMRFYSKYPAEKMRHEVKRNYIAQLVKLYKDRALPPVNIEGNISYLVSGIENPVKNIEPGTTPGEITPAKRAASNPGATRPRDTNLDPSTGTNLTIRSAINSIQSAVKPSVSINKSPVESMISEKKAYNKSIKRLNRGDDFVSIGESDFTDFGIISGYRDPDETTAIANENKKYVRHCIDKVYRNDPTLKGNIIVKFDIHPEGYIVSESIRVVESDIKDERILRCIKRSIRRWRNFPRVAYEMGLYSVTQKFIF